ncbi:c-type cytochrome [Ideonella sp. DXS29W]|uniref:C-type cytochrome n=1 Tax=Ideonella lacteola TaxID=2984193 RepID=A0ABU9BJZ7_9BURK
MNYIKAISLCVTLAAASSLAQAQVKGDAKAGEKKNAMCIGCHGIEGYQASFPQIYRVPKISGQNGKYLVSALEAYRKGDRQHPTMRAIAGSLTDQDIADLAAFYEGHGKDAAAAAAPAQVELPADLKEKMAVCVTCHGTNFNNTTDPANPRLAGQYADYLTASLRAYQNDTKHLVGRSNATMGAMAKPLKDTEVEQIAKFLSGLQGDLRTVPNAKFR